MEGLTVGSERAPTRCPYCKDGLDPSKELVACAPCGARHHASCHAAHGRCAACGATDVLVPARRRPRREQPPEGSKIAVERRDDRTTYTWDPRSKNDIIVIVLTLCFVLTAPVALLILWLRRKHQSASVVVTPDHIEFTGVGRKSAHVRARRDEVGAIRVQSVHEAGVQLTIDVGIKRHAVRTGITGSALEPPELEWLAEQLCAWRDEA